MDFGKLAGKAFDAYQEHQHKGEGQQGQQSGGGGGGSGGSTDTSALLGQAMSFINQRKDEGHYDDTKVNEDELKQAHNNVQSDEKVHPDTIGQGAAVEALKMFIGGSGGQGHGNQGGVQNQFVQMAMQQAGKMFDQKHANGQVKGDGNHGDMKQQAMQMAGDYAMKMFMQGQKDSGGAGVGQLMGMAQKFMH